MPAVATLPSPAEVRAQLEAATLPLDSGGHDVTQEAFCVMEAVAYIAGETWSDHPQCVCPVISTFLRSWNDSLPDDATRTRLLAPLALLCVGTRSTPAIELKRSWMAFDWLVRECAAEFLSLTESLKPHAESLRGLAPIDATNCDAVVPIVQSAGDAAGAAWDAAGAAGAAAWDAARAALQPSVERLQTSATDLVKRMCAVTE